MLSYGYEGKHGIGTETDGANTVMLMGARLYNPATGRFLQVDPDFPMLSASANAYDYCDQDPINCSDLSGLSPQPAQLSPGEDEAIYNKDHGLPYDAALYKAGMRKIQQAEKYGGDRNKQKQRGSRAPQTPEAPPTSESVLSQMEQEYAQHPHPIVEVSLIGAVLTLAGAALYYGLDALGFL